ncbi:Transcriptional regulatory protein UhpA [Corynebacterium occultum]|uniref:Transcriptional regulatory protein UhpA n=1 Tax=Corynebacterium occultum TaxID=2675219 RepID=A0A6B8W849_9CORY|nr:response regulator transcription factor [Corynebacterium occultum]QGU07066.1 Transcriptional regulatory protein UhpA [Corynebacterium occultum]
MTIKVVAIDDHAAALAGVSHVLGDTPDCEVVAMVHTVDEALDRICRRIPTDIDVALLDLRLTGGSDPFNNARSLMTAGAHVLVYSSLESPFLVRRALKAGVSGVVDKSADTDTLVTAIREAAEGKTVANANWAGIIDSDPLLNAVQLSPRQREVLELYAIGESAKRVASITGLSAETVQDYLSRIRTKYALAGRPIQSKIDLYRRAQEDGFLPGPRDM